MPELAPNYLCDGAVQYKGPYIGLLLDALLLAPDFTIHCGTAVLFFWLALDVNGPKWGALCGCSNVSKTSGRKRILILCLLAHS